MGLLRWETRHSHMALTSEKLFWHHVTLIALQHLSSLGPMHSSYFFQRLEFHVSLPSSKLNKCILHLVCRQTVKHCYPWQSFQIHRIRLPLLNVIDTSQKKTRAEAFSFLFLYLYFRKIKVLIDRTINYMKEFLGSCCCFSSLEEKGALKVKFSTSRLCICPEFVLKREQALPLIPREQGKICAEKHLFTMLNKRNVSKFPGILFHF